MRTRTAQEVTVQQKLCDHAEIVVDADFHAQLEQLEVELRNAVSPEAYNLFLRYERMAGLARARVIAEAFWQGVGWIRASMAYGEMFPRESDQARHVH